MDRQPACATERRDGVIAEGAPTIHLCDRFDAGCVRGTMRNAMRLKSSIWVAAYIRRCAVEGAPAVVRRRGAEEAGAVFVRIDRLDGTSDLYGPAPQAAFDEAKPAERAFVASMKRQPAPDADVESYLRKQIGFDPDLWIVEVEDRAGRHFLERVVS
jgi:hypothetical protein